MLLSLRVACEIAAIMTLAAASFHDLRSRQVPDATWVPGIALGVIVKLLDYEGTILFIFRYWYFLILFISLLIIEWKLHLSGEADLLAYLTLGVLLSGNRMFPDILIVYFLSKIFIVLIIPVQFFLNILRIVKNPDLIRYFDEPVWRKLLAMMLLSPYDERLSICASPAEVIIDGRRKFLLRAALKLSCDQPVEGGWIAPTYPAIPMIFAALLVLAI